MLEKTLSWTADLARGLPALTGSVPFEVTVAHDPAPRPSPTPTASPLPGQGPMISGGWVQHYEELTVDGSLTIAGPAPRLVTAGEALDIVLADPGFATWLAAMPRSTWTNANLYLQTGSGEGIVPVQPAWSVELFRERGVPRNWAIGYVDAVSGELLGLHYCNNPCDR
jgi:hypothetical protein